MDSKWREQMGVSLLGFGTMRLPQTDSEDPAAIDYPKAQEMIDYAMAHGVNYFDTAYTYHKGQSERFIGQALKKYPRESYFLATKMPTWLLKSKDDLKRIFEHQLEKCQVEYFDFYLVHDINVDDYDNFIQYQMYDFLAQKKAEGKIRHLGFSFHDTPELLQQVASSYDWDFAQIQLNYIDWELQNAKRQYEILEELGLPVIVMEPVRGGALATLNPEAVSILQSCQPDASPASWALRYAASLPAVLTILSGMSTLAQVEDNTRTLKDAKPLTSSERQVLEQAYTAYRSSLAVPCTNCRYCMDCPAGVDIPKNFTAYNQYAVTKNKIGFLISYRLLGDKKQASSCVHCNRCVTLCPQHIPIPEELAKISRFQAELEKQSQ